MSATGYLKWNGSKWVLDDISATQGERGFNGKSGITNVQDGYIIPTIFESFNLLKGANISAPINNISTRTVVNDLSVVSANPSSFIADVTASDKRIYVLDGYETASAMYVYDALTLELVETFEFTEALQWKSLKYVRLKNAELIAIASTNGFSYFRIDTVSYIDTTTTGITTPCSEIYADADEFSIFTNGQIIKFYNAPGSSTILSTTITPNASVTGSTDDTIVFHKAFGYYWKSSTTSNQFLYKINETSTSKIELSFTNTTGLISDSGFMYALGYSGISPKTSKVEVINPVSFLIENTYTGSNLNGDLSNYFIDVIFDGKFIQVVDYDAGVLFQINPYTGTAAYVSSTNKIGIAKCNVYDQTEYAVYTWTNLQLLELVSNKKQLLRDYISAGAILRKITEVSTSPYEVLEDDNTIAVDTTGGAITVNLPILPYKGRQLIILDPVGTAAANNITISDTTFGIIGSTSYTLNSNYQSVTLLFTGAQWIAI
ncbi:MAG: hypothetical protein LC122_13330 [Chitinophagales bacterium]|nr:hypothetical protein [Chitinophagales bacterium]